LVFFALQFSWTLERPHVKVLALTDPSRTP
jgi:hypothetical protein